MKQYLLFLFVLLVLCIPTSKGATITPDSLQHLKQLAEQGDTDAQCNLGYCYEYGQGVTKDYSQAVYWYRKSAEQGNAMAQKNLGFCYKNGQGVTKDYSQAVYWYRKSAEQGNAGAQCNLGICYHNGQGVTKDYTQAVYWYRKSAEQGDASGQSNLGVCYHNGQGVTKDYSQAVYWYRKSAEQGNATAQSNLGYCYEYGQGVAKDRTQAISWYRKAANQGLNFARERLNSLLNPTSDDIKSNGGYASAVELKNGNTKYWKVSKGGRYGLTDAEGKVIVPTEMETLESAGAGYLRYKLNGFWGLMNFAGKIIIDTDRGYTSIGDYNSTTKHFTYTINGSKGECDETGRQISRIKIAYNDLCAYGLKGNVKKCVRKQGDFVMDTKEFDRNGNLIFKEFLESLEKMTHNSEGRLTDIVIKSSHNSNRGYKFEYNSKGQVVRYIYNGEASMQKGCPPYTDVYEYTYKDDAIISEKYTRDGSSPTIHTFSNYKYDSHGNWIHREYSYKSVLFGDMHMSEDREIEYY